MGTKKNSQAMMRVKGVREEIMKRNTSEAIFSYAKQSTAGMRDGEGRHEHMLITKKRLTQLEKPLHAKRAARQLPHG